MNVPKVNSKMFSGIVGDIVEVTADHTEASPVTIAAHFLPAFGNAVGRGPHTYVGETRHGLNENVLVVGKTATGRKGDGRHVGMMPVELADPVWADHSIASGLSSGEGVIYAVRDPIYGLNQKGDEVLRDKGAPSKQLFVCEPEFSQPLKMFRREGNILSDVLRRAWDGERMLRTLVKNSPLRATEAHISVVGHTTPGDLRAHLTTTDVCNGVANRWLIVLVERVRLLASPKRLPDHARRDLTSKTQAALERARSVTRLERTPAAEALWRETYPRLTSERPGLAGELLARGPAHVLRLSSLFSLLSHARTREGVTEDHLAAALAWWDYVTASVESLFEDRTGNADADRIKAEMVPGDELSLTAIYKQVFGNHITTGRLKDALEVLRSLGVVEFGTRQSGGRPVVVVRRLEPKRPREPGEEG